MEFYIGFFLPNYQNYYGKKAAVLFAGTYWIGGL